MRKSISMNLTESIVKRLDIEAEKVGFQSRSNLIRILLDAALSHVESGGFHPFMEDTAKIKREEFDDKNGELQ